MTLGRRQRLLGAAEGGEVDAEVAEARREIGVERLGTRLRQRPPDRHGDRKSTRLNSSHT